MYNTVISKSTFKTCMCISFSLVSVLVQCKLKTSLNQINVISWYFSYFATFFCPFYKTKSIFSPIAKLARKPFVYISSPQLEVVRCFFSFVAIKGQTPGSVILANIRQHPPLILFFHPKTIPTSFI